MRQLRDLGARGRRMSEVRESLLARGWEIRHAPDFTVRETLRANRCPAPDWLERVVSDFDGLHLRFERNGREDEIYLSPKAAILGWFPWRIEDYAARSGEELVPLGCTYHENLLLLVDALGRWYGGHEDQLWLVGDSVFEAADRIVSGQSFDREL